MAQELSPAIAAAGQLTHTQAQTMVRWERHLSGGKGLAHYERPRATVKPGLRKVKGRPPDPESEIRRQPLRPVHINHLTS